MKSLRALAVALENHKARHGQYPVSDEVPLVNLVAVLALPSGDSLPTQDAWRHDLLYMSSGESYVAWSRGKDGVTDEVRPGGPVPKFEADVIMANGVFWQHLEGMEVLRSLPKVDPMEEVRKALGSVEKDAS